MSENEMAQRIRDLRRERGLTLEQVASVVGVGKSTVRKWETGMIANMRRDKIALLASALGTTPGYLMGWEDSLPQEGSSGDPENSHIRVPHGFDPLPDMVEVPILGQIACGEPILAEENLDGFVSIPGKWRASFVIVCRGDSMEPRIKNGDIVALRPQPSVENGEVAAVRIGDEATLKRVYQDTDRLVLQPENPAYAPIVLVGDEINEVAIVGRAVGLCRDI